MPELPEVEAARSLVERACGGKKIKLVVAADDNSEQSCVEGWGVGPPATSSHPLDGVATGRVAAAAATAGVAKVEGW